MILALDIFATPRLVWAHDGDPRVEISSDRLQPGLVLEVRGVNIAAEEQITVSLVRVAGEFLLGIVTGNEHGDFIQPFTVPVDLPEGTYKVLAQSSNLPVVSAPILIQGPPVLAEESEGELREEEDALLAPMPTVPKAQAAEPVPQPTSGAPSPWPSLVIIIGVMVALGLAALIRRMQTSAPREES